LHNGRGRKGLRLRSEAALNRAENGVASWSIGLFISERQRTSLETKQRIEAEIGPIDDRFEKLQRELKSQ